MMNPKKNPTKSLDFQRTERLLFMCSVFELKTNLFFFFVERNGTKRLRRRLFFVFVKVKNPVVFFFKRHILTSERFWSQQWGDKILYSHGSNPSAETAMCLNNCSGEIRIFFVCWKTKNILVTFEKSYQTYKEMRTYTQQCKSVFFNFPLVNIQHPPKTEKRNN